MPLPEDPRAEQRQELARYRADSIAAHAPLLPSLLAGALASLCVLLLPLVIFLGSLVVLRLSYSAVTAPAEYVFRTFHLGVYRSGGAPPTEVPLPTLVPTPEPGSSGLEGDVPGPSPGPSPTALKIALLPVATIGLGLLMAAVYRVRRRRRAAELERTPLDFSILPDVILLYLLLAAGGLLLQLGEFLSIGATIVVAWGGYLVWRFAHDRLLTRFVPEAVRSAAEQRVILEKLRRNVREESAIPL